MTEGSGTTEGKEDCVFDPQEFIPIGYFSSERVIVGHNVSFDRSYLKEQYNLNPDKTRFLDTMGLHISISGLTGYQRALSLSHRSARKKGVNEAILSQIYRMKKQPNPVLWEENGALNNLVDVYKFYCQESQDYKELQKEMRNVFVEGSLQEIRDDFQNLCGYCANDVLVTSRVFRKQWPLYLERFPHPVSLAGTLEMSVMYLPVNSKRWKKYLKSAQDTFQKMEDEVTLALTKMADEACSYLHENKYQKDVWLWDLDWKTNNVKFKKLQKTAAIDNSDFPVEKFETAHVKQILQTRTNLMKVQPHLAGYPSWYRDFCSPLFMNRAKLGLTLNAEWEPGPHLISTQMRTVPKLMRLTWDGYALHHSPSHGWGFIVPRITNRNLVEASSTAQFPLEEYSKLVSPYDFRHFKEEQQGDDSESFILFEAIEEFENPGHQKKDEGDSTQTTKFPPFFSDEEVEGCRFFKLPHREGPDKNVGNPLSRDFMKFVEDGRLRVFGSDIAMRTLKLANSLSYWKLASKRILSQMVVETTSSGDGAILPRVIVSGTVTRRAVEPTWLTASNAQKTRIGSELKGMISAPVGHVFVGADVDSQELWIASLLGDSYFARIHGCTGIGWMTLQGSKETKTDMHSTTASLVDISRDQAKVLNYGRIYGAGKAFASRFLKQSNPTISEEDARKKAHEIYKRTKGFRSGGRWTGGSESAMFNMLEMIAKSSEPSTPVLGCRVSRGLESDDVKEAFMTSLINWVVQSSAVDYLHLMLVSMKWLFESQTINGRFAISIHDEIRYLVPEEDKYRAALALQITNLLTRSMFCARLGMRDLPVSVAFFSGVDIDTVLRKEVYDDCKTPSNPLGLEEEYQVLPGQSLNMNQLLEKIKTLT